MFRNPVAGRFRCAAAGKAPGGRDAQRQSLSSILIAHAPEECRAALAVIPNLDAALAELAESGQKRWPELPVADVDFVAFLARCLPAASLLDPMALRTEDLHLVCAYGLGVPGASAVVEERCLSRVEKILARIGIQQAMVADVCQEMRLRLVEMAKPPPGKKTYAGRGHLVSWLCISAVREANLRRDREKREVPLESLGPTLLATASDPEMEYLEQTHKHEFGLAFQGAIATLSHRERNLLRYHVLEGLSIDWIGALYGVHRSTAARWIEHARHTLCEQTREEFCRRASASRDSFQQLLTLIASQIGPHLAAVAAETH